MASNSIVSMRGLICSFAILLIVVFGMPVIMDTCLVVKLFLYIKFASRIFIRKLYQHNFLLSLVITGMLINYSLQIMINHREEKYMKKKFIALILSLSMALALLACGDNSADSPSAANAQTTESITPTPSESNNTPTPKVTTSPLSSDSTDISIEDAQNNLDIQATPTQDGLMCVFITNNNDITIDELEVQVNYKDESGSIIDTDKDGHDMILPGHTVVSRLDSPDSYSDFEVTSSIELNVHPNYQNHSESISVSSNQGDDCVIIEITNNSDITIDELEYIVVFYSGNEISTVSYPEDVSDVKTSDVLVEKCASYGITYDSFKVYLNQAHTFDI